jgi:hypothetical protein
MARDLSCCSGHVIASEARQSIPTPRTNENNHKISFQPLHHGRKQLSKTERVGLVSAAKPDNFGYQAKSRKPQIPYLTFHSRLYLA